VYLEGAETFNPLDLPPSADQSEQREDLLPGRTPPYFQSSPNGERGDHEVVVEGSDSPGTDRSRLNDLRSDAMGDIRS
jgi:hypothetical protein